jgi:hypothetical protein
VGPDHRCVLCPAEPVHAVLLRDARRRDTPTERAGTRHPAPVRGCSDAAHCMHAPCSAPAPHASSAQERDCRRGAARRGCWILCSLPHLRSRLVRVLRGAPESSRPVRAAYAVPLSTITHDDGRLRRWPWTRAAPRWRSSARTCRMRRRRWRPPVPSRAPPAAPTAPPLPLPAACGTRRPGSCECSMGLAWPQHASERAGAQACCRCC